MPIGPCSSQFLRADQSEASHRQRLRPAPRFHQQWNWPRREPRPNHSWGVPCWQARRGEEGLWGGHSSLSEIVILNFSEECLVANAQILSRLHLVAVAGGERFKNLLTFN